MNLNDLIEEKLLYYAKNKVEIDINLQKAFEVNYNIVDIYDDSGLKIVSMLTDSSSIVDCRYINLDLYDSVLDVAKLLREHDYGLFLILRP